MPNFICQACGTQFAKSARPPERCGICEDERQYVGWSGQRWTTIEQLGASHRLSLRREEPGLTALAIEPKFAIGQRAFVVKTAAGNVLWDCLSLIDGAVVDALAAMGGVKAMAISHPHYYSSMVEWSRALGGVPIYLHADDRQWVMRPDDAIVFWEGEIRPLLDGLTLVRCGGHFAGGTVLHWPLGAGGQGALLSGDILQVSADRLHVSFMWSYPNYVPLSAQAVRQIVAAVEPLPFERIYGAFAGLTIDRGGKQALRQSAKRYLHRIAGDNEGRQPLVVGPGEGPRFGIVGDVYRFLARHEDTAGRYALFEATVAPGGGPPRHVHSREDEGFYVLEGEITFAAGDRSFKAGPGTFVNLPPGVPHRFHNEAATASRMLVLVSPAGLERMFGEVGAILGPRDAAASPPSPAEIERLLAVAPRYGITIFAPIAADGATTVAGDPSPLCG